MTPVRERMGHGLSRERALLELRRSLRPLVICAAMAALAIASLAVIFKNLGAHWPWVDTEQVRIAVDDAAGVVPGTQEVRISGIPVGKITGSELEDGQPVLTLTLDPDRGPLYANAQLRLRPETPLQDMYVDIEDRGSPGAGELSADEILPAARTETAVDMGDVLNAFDADTRGRLEEFTDHFGRGLEDRGVQLEEAFVEIVPFLRAAQRLSRETARRGDITRRLVHNLRTLTEELALRDQQLVGLVQAGGATFGELAARDAELAETLDELPPSLDQLEATFATLRNTLAVTDPALLELRPAVAALAPGLEALQRIGETGAPALAKLRRPVRELGPLVTALESTATRLATALLRLRPQAPRLDRVTRALEGCEFEVQKFFQWTPSVFKFSDAHGLYPRGETVFTTNTGGGAVEDPNLMAGESCASGHPTGGSRR